MIRTTGLRETVKRLEQLGVDSSDMKESFVKIGNLVVNKAKPLTNPKSGTLARSIRASKTKNRSTIRAGGARIPYAGVIHFGGYHNIEAKMYLWDAVAQSQRQGTAMLEQELKRIIARNGLS